MRLAQFFPEIDSRTDAEIAAAKAPVDPTADEARAPGLFARMRAGVKNLVTKITTKLKSMMPAKTPTAHAVMDEQEEAALAASEAKQAPRLSFFKKMSRAVSGLKISLPDITFKIPSLRFGKKVRNDAWHINDHQILNLSEADLEAMRAHDAAKNNRVFSLKKSLASLREKVSASIPEKHKGLIAAGAAVGLAVALVSPGKFAGVGTAVNKDTTPAPNKATTTALKGSVNETCPTGAEQLASILPSTQEPKPAVIPVPATALSKVTLPTTGSVVMDARNGRYNDLKPAAPTATPAQVTPVVAKQVAPAATPAQVAPVVAASQTQVAAHGRVSTTFDTAPKAPPRHALKAQVAKTNDGKGTHNIAKTSTVDHAKTAKTGHAPAASKVRNVPQVAAEAFGLTQAQYDNMSPKNQSMLRAAVKSGAATHVEYTPINGDVAYSAAAALINVARDLSGDMTNAKRNEVASNIYKQALRLAREGKMYGKEFMNIEVGKYAYMQTGVPGVKRNDEGAATMALLAQQDTYFAKKTIKFLQQNNPEALNAGAENVALMNQYKLLGPFADIVKSVSDSDVNTPLHPAKKTTSQALQKVKMSHLAKTGPKI